MFCFDPVFTTLVPQASLITGSGLGGSQHCHGRYLGILDINTNSNTNTNSLQTGHSEGVKIVIITKKPKQNQQDSLWS